MKKRRFFFHWRKQTDTWSVHFKGVCHKVDHITCHVGCETKRNKRQPLRVMQGLALTVDIRDGVATIL